MKIKDIIVESIDKQYPDNKLGAKEALFAMGDESVKKDFANALYIPDRTGAGVWGAVNKQGEMAVIYLKGYADPFGKIRDRNDFETGKASPQLMQSLQYQFEGKLNEAPWRKIGAAGEIN